jgi:PAS domain S-box-containing protein
VIDRVDERSAGTVAAAAIAGRLGAVLDSVADGITVQDPSGRVVYANAAAVRVIGFHSAAELLAATPVEILARFELFDEAGSPLPISALPGRLALKGTPEPGATIGFRIVATGEEHWSQVRATPLLDGDGRVIFAINTFHDVTERLRMEAELRASEGRYRQLVQAMPQIAWTTDPDGRVTMLNQRWAQYAGRAGAVGASLESDDAIHPEDRAELARRWSASRATGSALEVATRLRRHDGAYRWHLLRAMPMRQADGAIGAWIGTSTDIEEAKRAESGLRLLADATIRLDATLDVQETVDAAAAIAVPTLADWCFIDLIEADGAPRRRAVLTADADRTRTAERLRAFPLDPAGPSPVAAAMRAGQPVVLDDFSAASLEQIARTKEHGALLREVDPNSAMALPLMARGRTLGVMLLVATRSGRRYDAADLELAADLARRAAVAISNAELYAGEQTAREAAEGAARRTDRLQRATRALAGALSREEVMEIVLREACDATGATAGAILLRDDDDLALGAWRGVETAAAKRHRRIPLDAAVPAAKAARTGHPVWVPASGGGVPPQLLGPTDQTGGEAACAVPIGIDHAPRGALALVFPTARNFGDDDRAFLIAHADLCSQALERVGLGEAREELLKSLGDQRSRLETVLRQMPAGVLISDADGTLVLSNEHAAQIWREPIPSGREIGDYKVYVANRPTGEPYAIDEWPLARALRAGETVTGEIMAIVRFDGSRGWISVDAAPVRDRDGRIVAAVSTFTDVTETRDAADRQRFLGDASSLLASSLDYEATIRRVADLAVPTIADWCTIDLVGSDGKLEHLAVAHVDPAKVELAHELRRRFPPDPAATTGVPAVLRSQKSELISELPPGVFDVIEDPELRQIIDQLELHSYMCVPLIAGGESIGAITFIGAESGRRFDADDLALAENLAARAASAVQNARLFRDVGRYKATLDATLDAVYMFDPHTLRFSYVNLGAVDQVGYDARTLLAMNPTMLAVDLDEPHLRLLIAPLLDGRLQSRTITLTQRHRSGRRLPVEVLLQYVKLPEEAGRIVAIARDISDRVEAQARLQRLAEAEHARAAELNAVIRAMGEGVVVCDREGAISLANPAAEELFPGVASRSYAEILDQFEEGGASAPALGTRGGPVELRVRGEDERWIELSTYPVAARRLGKGTPRDDGETIVLLRDVTVPRQRQAVRDTFIGVLSHELRTPVTTIYAGSKVLARGSSTLDEDVRRSVFEDIHVEAERLHRLVEDVIALTRFGEEQAEIGDEPVLLQRILPAVVRSEEARWPGVKFQLRVPGGLPTVSADATYVEQVVRNLLSNAAKYGGAKARVEIVLEAVRDEVQVRIQDDGPGFPPGEADKLFELYYRSPSTAGAASGAGIGLFVCARLIRAMGGRIWALPRADRGAEFGFSLRVMRED